VEVRDSKILLIMIDHDDGHDGFSRIGGMTCGFLRGFLDERRRGLISSGMAAGGVDESVSE
jgi:hypothetical protein